MAPIKCKTPLYVTHLIDERIALIDLIQARGDGNYELWDRYSKKGNQLHIQLAYPELANSGQPKFGKVIGIKGLLRRAFPNKEVEDLRVSKDIFSSEFVDTAVASRIHILSKQ